MSQPENKASHESLQELICRLDGVYAAKVVLSPKDSSPQEIHVLASEAKSPKALTRDIQSALMAAFDVEVDYRIISIAQVHPQITGKETRLSYVGIEVKYINGSGNISVFLSHKDQVLEGKATYIGRQRLSHIRGVALATLDAIGQYLKSLANCHFELITADIIEVIGNPVALVVLSDEERQQYIGSTFVRENNDDAVVRAVLSSLNRKISRLIDA